MRKVKIVQKTYNEMLPRRWVSKLKTTYKKSTATAIQDCGRRLLMKKARAVKIYLYSKKIKEKDWKSVMVNNANSRHKPTATAKTYWASALAYQSIYLSACFSLSIVSTYSTLINPATWQSIH